ncbi:MAG: hypothetical protein H6733_09520 [Alphaproteobacteria bacterium]|nr:hypothetical protein [Alphaproteobacteria bacterium]
MSRRVRGGAASALCAVGLAACGIVDVPDPVDVPVDTDVSVDTEVAVDTDRPIDTPRTDDACLAPSIGRVDVSAVVDGSTPLDALGESGLLALCGALADDTLVAHHPDSCVTLDQCLMMASLVIHGPPIHGEPAGTDVVANACTLTATDFATCLAARAQGACDVDKVAPVPGCEAVWNGLMPARSLPASETDVWGTLMTCQLAGLERGDPAFDVEDCTLRLSASLCGCEADASAPGCDVTVGDLVGCIAGDTSESAACDLVYGATPSPPVPRALVTDLTCSEARLLCGSKIARDPALFGDHPDCPPPDGGSFYNAAETCVRNLSSVQFRCAIDPTTYGCGFIADDVVECIADTPPGTCPDTRRCFGNVDEDWDGGVDKAVASLSVSERRAFCTWKLALQGGDGFTPVGCSHNIPAASTLTMEGCMAELSTLFDGCQVTVGALAECTTRMYVQNDTCHQLGNYGSCAENSDWESCHLLAGCAPEVARCLGN